MCEICEKKFSTNQSKEKHISIVHGEVKIIECNVCGKTFGQNHKLIMHIETNHKGIRNHKCDYCPLLDHNI